MRYMCTVRMDPEVIGEMTAADWSDFQRDTQRFDDALMAHSRFVMASPLDGEKVRTLRLRKGAMLVTDGPFAETKEFIAGFIVFDADSLQHAVATAQGSAFVRVGSVELREMTNDEGRSPAGEA